jgi:tetratricopeptide (TPR) repeat protein
MHAKSQDKLEGRIRNGSKNADDYFDLADVYFFKGMFDQMLELLGKLRNLSLSDTDKAHLYQQEAEAFLSLGRIKEAEWNYRKSLEAIESPEDSFEYLWIMGRAHYTLSTLSVDNDTVMEHSKAALECLTKALTFEAMAGEEQRNRLAFVYSWIADMHSKMGRLDDSLRIHEKALSLAIREEDVVEILTDIAMVYTMKGNFGKAEKTFREALRRAQTAVPTTKIYFEMGKMYVSWGKISEAMDAFRNALKELDGDLRLKNSSGYETSVIWYLGFAAYGLGYGEEAIRCMNTVLERVDKEDLFHLRSHSILANQYYKDVNDAKAREHFHEVLLSPLADSEDIETAKKYLATIPLDS